MAAEFIEVATAYPLGQTLTIDTVDVTEITITKIIKRPVIKRIVSLIEGFDRIIVWEGDIDYPAHITDDNATIAAATVAAFIALHTA